MIRERCEKSVDRFGLIRSQEQSHGTPSDAGLYLLLYGFPEIRSVNFRSTWTGFGLDEQGKAVLGGDRAPHGTWRRSMIRCGGADNVANGPITAIVFLLKLPVDLRTTHVSDRVRLHLLKTSGLKRRRGNAERICETARQQQ